MKIKTITCHDVYNYGASLQAYALQTYLTSIGHDVEIIDYLPDYISGRYKFFNILPNSRLYKYAIKNKLFYFLCCLYQVKRKYSTYGRKKVFDSFKEEYLLCTKLYKDYQELKADPPTADAYVVGSDQVWSCTSAIGKDPAFYLDFGSSSIKRYSYAASFGQSKIQPENKALVFSKLQKFNGISVRENTGLEILQSLSIEGINVVDPVLLLNQEDWNQLIPTERIVKKNYILVYDLYHADTEMKEAVCSVAKNNGLKIVSINSRSGLNYADINISNAGPIEFLNLIKYCTYCFSNSFHATAFSVIFHKPFYVFNRHDNVSRIKDFLTIIDMEQCLNPEQMNVIFNYNVIDNRLQKMIITSKKYLDSF